jgi:hypothetical protein
LYGCRPEEDLFKMKPRGPLKKHLERCERHKKYEPDIPVLLILFRIYDCWDEPYWDMIARTKKRLRSQRTLPNLTHTAIDPKIRMLNHFKQYRPDVVEVLVSSFLRSARVRYLFRRHEPRSTQRERLEWYMNMVVKYFWKRAHIWGYIEDERLLGVVIWGDPSYCKRTSVSQMLAGGGNAPFGHEKYDRMRSVLNAEQAIQRAQQPKGWWTLHWIGVVSYAQRRGIGSLLVENIMCKLKSSGVYVQVTDGEQEGVYEFLSKHGFVERSSTTLPAKKKSTRAPAKIKSMTWRPEGLALSSAESGNIFMLPAIDAPHDPNATDEQASKSNKKSNKKSKSSSSLLLEAPPTPLDTTDSLYSGNLLQ